MQQSIPNRLGTFDANVYLKIRIPLSQLWVVHLNLFPSSRNPEPAASIRKIFELSTDLAAKEKFGKTIQCYSKDGHPDTSLELSQASATAMSSMAGLSSDEPPYSIYTRKEKWLIVAMVALGGFYRFDFLFLC